MLDCCPAEHGGDITPGFRSMDSGMFLQDNSSINHASPEQTYQPMCLVCVSYHRNDHRFSKRMRLVHACPGRQTSMDESHMLPETITLVL